MDHYIEGCLFNNVGFMQSIISEEALAPIKEEIFKIQDNFVDAVDYNQYLAGHIEKEYKIVETKNYLETLLYPLVCSYDQIFDYTQSHNSVDKNLPLTLSLDSAWVNFQKKYEFNPPHNHSGVLSFVIFVDIPYDIQDETNQFPTANGSSAGCFNFLYSSSNGSITSHTIPADKTFNNTILIFPSSMFHYVNPFYTSDEYRITVSGNFCFVLDSR